MKKNEKKWWRPYEERKARGFINKIIAIAKKGFS